MIIDCLKIRDIYCSRYRIYGRCRSLSIPDANVIMDEEKFLLSALVVFSNIFAVTIAAMVGAKVPCILKGIYVRKVSKIIQ